MKEKAIVQGFSSDLEGRNRKGLVWYLVFLASTIVGILALIALMLNIINGAFGYVAYEAKVDPDTLPAEGVPITEQSKEQLVTLGCVISTAALGTIGPGELWLAAALLIVSNFCYAAGVALNSAFLPELSRPEALGKVSGWGWSFGYFGGMLTLGLSLASVLTAQARGATATEFVPVTMWITALVYGMAALVTFWLLKEHARPQSAPTGATGLAASLARLRDTWRHARAYRDFFWLLVCGFFYQAGIAVVIALAAVYAETLEEADIRRLGAGEQLVGTGGSLRNLAKVDQRASDYPIARLHGYELTRRRLHEIALSLAGERQKKRRVPGLNADRRDSVVAGAIVIETLMQVLGADAVVVSGQGVREGLALSMARETLDAAVAVRRRSLDALAARFVGWSEDRASRREAVAAALYAALERWPSVEMRTRCGRGRACWISGARSTSSTATSTSPTWCSPPISPASRTARWRCWRPSCGRPATRTSGSAPRSSRP